MINRTYFYSAYTRRNGEILVFTGLDSLCSWFPDAIKIYEQIINKILIEFNCNRSDLVLYALNRL